VNRTKSLNKIFKKGISAMKTLSKPREELLIEMLLDVRDKYPDFKYEVKGLSFIIKRKGWFGEKLFKGVINENGRLIVDALDLGDSNRIKSLLSSKKGQPIDSPKEDNEVVALGNYLDAQYVKLFNKGTVFNMLTKVK
jgi:hypothetical protein